MRIVTMYLPQFHRIPENDQWWGEGFTEWSAVKAATPLFEGHDQPKIPLDYNYYNLMEKETMIKQADLMKEYGIDGMCIYHYWFKEGRQILEKPAENLLNWKDIKMPFCFSWANDTWARSWSAIVSKNSWSDVYEPPKNSDGQDVLLEQSYGKERDWKDHFNYLLPFFMDSRYIKIDEKPVFVIYRASDIYCLGEMIACWKELALEKGLKGLYIIGANCERDLTGIIDGQMYQEPGGIMRKITGVLEGCDVKGIEYETAWKMILRRRMESKLQPYFCGFVRYDDTPRRGNKGLVIRGESPEVFKDGLAKLIAKNRKYNSDITFINAWNEWGEGMYLEPDTKSKYIFLEKINEARQLSHSVENECNDIDETISGYDTFNKRVNINMIVLDRWLEILENNKSVANYIKENINGTIGIYGYGVLGRHLYRELSNEQIPIMCVIDKNKHGDDLCSKIYKPNDSLPNVDSIIVTSIYYYDEIRVELSDMMDCTIFSLEEIINNCLEQ